LGGQTFAFEMLIEKTTLTATEIKEAESVRDGVTQPSHLVGRVAQKIASDMAEGFRTMDLSSKQCYKIKNDALKAYCERGENACGEFGFSSNKSKFNIPGWVEDFCRSNYSIKDKNLDDYYRSGYTTQFKEDEIYRSATKYKNDMQSRKKWVIYYANSYILK
jgi:hypothetical protein